MALHGGAVSVRQLTEHKLATRYGLVVSALLTGVNCADRDGRSFHHMRPRMPVSQDTLVMPSRQALTGRGPAVLRRPHLTLSKPQDGEAVVDAEVVRRPLFPFQEKRPVASACREGSPSAAPVKSLRS